MQELVDSGTLRLEIRNALDFPLEGTMVNLLIVDIFLGKNLPGAFLQTDIWEQYKLCLLPDGRVVVNTIVDDEALDYMEQPQSIQQQLFRTLGEVFG